jgi:riboflavin-specific deaminase-like protein
VNRTAGPLDAGAAWTLVRAVRAAVDARDGRARPEAVEVGASGTTLRVEPDGTWTCSGSPSDEARALLDLYLPLVVRPTLVIGQLAQSLDGRIATETGASHYVSGPEDIERLHRLRAIVDAVVVGAGTVSADDPRLTVREAEGENPVRVVIDPEARLDPQRRVFLDGEARTVLVRRAPPDMTRARSLGDEVAVPSRGEGLLDLAELLEALRAQGLRRILVEGGGITVSRFLEAGLLDRLHVTVAPMLIGSGRPSFTLEPIRSLSDALRPPARHFALGDDVLFDLNLRGGSR